jgi:hypothetical protein
MSEPDVRKMLTAVRQVASTRGWRDPGSSIRDFVERVRKEMARTGSVPRSADLVEYIGGAFLAHNETDAHTVGEAFGAALATVPWIDPRLVIGIEEIDTFAMTASVAAADVAAFARPLDLPERTVKLLVAAIIGEPYVPKDWGGEGNDLYTDNVRLGATRIGAAFLLKGSGTAGTLTVRKLGKNGDQIIRMAQSPADLLVVQHVDRIDEAVRTTLMNAVLAKRQASSAAVGSIWDGVSCARLFVAHGYLDATSGHLTPKAVAALAKSP